ncbi:MAG: LbtU family siderophore porin [Pontiellaceae bacterium]|nr:LbtU family siderophore porin [Pontiellaceae bacterium]MBN2783630.1 LbtU family siderophore porin [Pontiellaceae bacterium]
MKKEIVMAALAAAMGGAAQAQAQTNEMSETVSEWTASIAETGLETLTWGLLLQVEGSYAETGGDGVSDLILRKAEFAMEAAMTEWLAGHVGLLWEENDTEENNLDEAYIVAGSDLYVQAGRFYLPFGNFESVFVSDSLPVELAEINQSSVMAGYCNDWFDVNIGAFKGAVDHGLDEAGNPAENTAIEDFYASATFMPMSCLQCGAYYLSDMMETDSQSELGINGETGYEKQDGAGAFVNIFLPRFMLNAEVVSSLDDYVINGVSVAPLAYNIEASVGVAEQWVVGLKYEGSEDLYAGYGVGGFEEKCHGAGYGGVVSYGFYEKAAVSLEYLRLEKLAGDEGGHLVTMQLALEM